MGACLTRARLRSLQQTFSEADHNQRGYIDQRQLIELFSKLGLRDDYHDPSIRNEIDFYMFINILERKLTDIFEAADFDKDFLVEFDDALHTFTKLGTDIVNEDRLILYLKRIQQNYPELIGLDVYLDNEFNFSLHVWLGCLMESIFSPIHDSAAELKKEAGSKKLQESVLHPENTLEKGGVVSIFKSKTPRFVLEPPTSLGPGEYEVSPSTTQRDTAKPSSSFLATTRKPIQNKVNNLVGPGSYELEPARPNPKKPSSSFQSSTARFGKGGPGDPALANRTGSTIGPGSYEPLKSQYSTQPRSCSFGFSKAPRHSDFLGVTSQAASSVTNRPGTTSSGANGNFGDRRLSRKSSSVGRPFPSPTTASRPGSGHPHGTQEASLAVPAVNPRRSSSPIGTSSFLSRTERFGPKPKYRLDFHKIIRDAERNGYSDILGSGSYSNADLYQITFSDSGITPFSKSSSLPSVLITQEEVKTGDVPLSAKERKEKWGSFTQRKSSATSLFTPPHSASKESKIFVADM